MCAVNVPKTVKFWIEELNKSRSDSANPMALHAFIEKVSIFTQEDQSSLAEDPETAAAVGALFTEYGAMLANQGAMETALKYISANDSGSNELRHRLFYASAMEQTGAPHPPLPFEQQKMVGVSPNFGKVFTLQQQQQQQQQEEQAAAAAVAAQQQQAAAAAAQAPTQPSGAGGAADANSGLPPGWIWQQDPATQQVFYVNTMNGHVQWEPPAPVAAAPVPAPAPALFASPAPAAQPMAAPTGVPAPAPVPAPTSVAESGVPKQDGFFSKPHTAPGAAGAAAAAAAAVPAGGVAAQDTNGIPADLKPIVSTLNQIVASLTNLAMSPPEKKQMGQITQAVSILLAKLNTGQIAGEVGQQALQLAQAVAARDYAAALQIHKAMVAKEWDKHKDWLKGIKNLVVLAKKYGS